MKIFFSDRFNKMYILKDAIKEKIKKSFGGIVVRFKRRLTVFNRFDENVIGLPRSTLHRRATAF